MRIHPLAANAGTCCVCVCMLFMHSKDRRTMVSNTRPDHGTRAMLTSGPSMTFVPLIRCSAPMAAPHCSMSAGDHACETVSCDGHCVTLMRPSATPWKWMTGRHVVTTSLLIKDVCSSLYYFRKLVSYLSCTASAMEPANTVLSWSGGLWPH